MTIQGAYKEIQGWELPSYAEPSRRKVLETIAEYFDTVTMVHGKWEKKEVFHAPDIEEMQSAQCDKCGKFHTTPFLYYFDDYEYCPRCGAKMDGERRTE